MKKQRGITLVSLLLWGVILFLLAVLGVKTVPEYVVFYKIKKIVASTAYNANGQTVPELRALYARYAQIDQVDEILKPSDLDIYKEGGRIVVAFAYEKRIPLFANVNLLLDFKGASVEP